MKKLIFNILFMMCVIGLHAQVTQEELDSARKDLKESKKDKKKKEKAYQALLDSAMYQNAILSIEAMDFVIEAERITFKRGNWRHVTPFTNFISVKDGRAVVQISFAGAPAGPNGMGGITVEGTVSDIQQKTDKRGNIYLSMSVTGVAVSARIRVQMVNGSHRVTATVAPNFSSNNFTMSGYLWPSSQSKVYKGRSL